MESGRLEPAVRHRGSGRIGAYRMVIAIDKLDEAQLRDLNRRIVERLRFLQQMRAHNAMLKLSIGDRVTFVGHEGQEVRGCVVRYNRKTVTVLAENGEQWRVSPGMLCKIGPEKEVVSNVVTLPRA